MKPDVIQSTFERSDCTYCIAMLTKDLAARGVYQVRLYEKVCGRPRKKIIFTYFNCVTRKMPISLTSMG